MSKQYHIRWRKCQKYFYVTHWQKNSWHLRLLYLQYSLFFPILHNYLITCIRYWFILFIHVLFVRLVEQELLTLPVHLRSPPVFSGVRVTRSLVLCVMFSKSLFVLLSFFFAIVLSLLRFTDSDYRLVSICFYFKKYCSWPVYV